MSDEATFVPARLPRLGYHIICNVLRFVFFLLCRVQVSGRENFPTTGNFMFVINHLSVVDVPFCYVILEAHRASNSVVFAADTWRKSIFTRLGMQLTNVIWVTRGETSLSTMRASLRVLNEGYILGVAPEGTRSRESHALIKGQTGAAYMALHGKVPVVPVALTNTEHLIPAIKRLRRITITATVGTPFRLEPCEAGSRPSRDCLEECTDEVMCRLAALLPPEYRGVYAEHPRVAELIKSESQTSS